MLRFHYCLSHMIFYITVLDLCQWLLSCMCFKSIGAARRSGKVKQQIVGWGIGWAGLLFNDGGG